MNINNQRLVINHHDLAIDQRAYVDTSSKRRKHFVKRIGVSQNKMMGYRKKKTYAFYRHLYMVGVPASELNWARLHSMMLLIVLFWWVRERERERLLTHSVG